jgi:hypothetical protein
MRLAIIGGVERQETRLIDLARARGHVLEFHGGHTAGRGADTLRAVVERAERVVVITGINSHPAVLLARKTARSLGKEATLVNNLGMSSFRRLLDSLEPPAAAATRAAA